MLNYLLNITFFLVMSVVRKLKMDNTCDLTGGRLGTRQRLEEVSV